MAKANDDKSAAGASAKNPVRKDGETSGDSAEGKQSSATSGTTPLAGDSATNNDKPGPGGVEGTGGNI